MFSLIVRTVIHRSRSIAIKSYCHREPDKRRVRKLQVLALEGKGLRALIDFRHFRLSAPLVTYMARAVKEIRFTIAVITGSYLQSNFSKLENGMAK